MQRIQFSVSTLLRTSAFFFSMALSGAPACAVTLIPMEMELTPQGRGATRVFRVENITGEMAAVEVTAKTRAMLENGEDELTDASDIFSVFPQQMILKPGQSQAVRVQWLGKEIPARELAYRLIAEQLPLEPAASSASKTGDVPASGVQIRVLMKYVASMYVVPPGALARIVPVSVETLTVNHQSTLRIVVENQGNAHRLLIRPRLTLTGANGASLVLEGAAVASLSGANLLAATRRVFDIPAPAVLPAGPLRLTLTENPANDSAAPVKALSH